VTAYYNEIDPYAAQWLRNLIAAGHIAPGEVDERSIVDVEAADLRGFDQCHFFAGIGGWSYALRLAGWDDARPVWTGSCPCQPFSVAGKRGGVSDVRHLWPEFYRLIAECRPATVFGEQVAGVAGYSWWDGVAADLESEGYAAAAADLGAHSVGGNHCRQRLYWIGANPDSVRSQRQFEESAAVRGTWGSQQFKGLVQESLQHAVPAGKSGALSDGIPARMGRLRAYGNAIVPQVAAAFIRAVA
jgi:DNA (cytosine-5)-methyltransferase 1